jgi:hypothetical protein
MRCFLSGLDSTRSFFFQTILIEGDSLSAFCKDYGYCTNHLYIIKLFVISRLRYRFGVDVENARKSETPIAFAVDLGVY